ncbi:NAD(P)/FAD-dependent oxidoreductase [Marinobacteraceae bacterium S3BR75-40.1]
MSDPKYAGTIQAKHTRVAIIGTGFSGLGMAIRLKQSGENDFRVFEKEAGVGGTWRVNHYPGCACDVQSHLYSYSFEPNPEWTRMFAPQKEIKGYLEHCAEKYRVLPHIHFNTALASAAWDNSDKLWRLTTQDGEQYTANVVVSGMGGLAIPAYPNIPGIDSFKGKTFHSQDWDHDYDLKGKRVAVIGTGASAIQFVPQIQPQLEQLDLYQRTPPWILPKPDRPITENERRLFRHLPFTQKGIRAAIYCALEVRVLGMAVDPRIMKLAERWALKYLRSEVADPVMRKQLTPDYAIGCKRILMSNDYYQALVQPNLNLITDGIERITEDGIITKTGEHRKVDAIIFGTGFKATDPVPKGLIKGDRGQDLNEIWQDGPESYKGSTVSGFPNFFMLMGPNTGLGHSSMVYMIESQIQYALDALNYMRKEHVRAVDVKPEKQHSYSERVQNVGHSVWTEGGCSSWYLHPKTGKNVTLWPGFTFRYRQQTRHFDKEAYRIDTGREARSPKTTATPSTNGVTA